jgi:hypothetical protein
MAENLRIRKYFSDIGIDKRFILYITKDLKK